MAGGFPPIKYCIKNDSQEKISKNTKERLFASNSKQQINIRQILTQKNKEPIIIIPKNDDEQLDIVDNL
jgi:hypothetical protein